MARRCGVDAMERRKAVLSLLRREEPAAVIARRFVAFVQALFQHVRIQYRASQQLGLLRRFYATLKTEEVYWRLHVHPQHCRECLTEFRTRYSELPLRGTLVPAEEGDVFVPTNVRVLGRAIQIPRWQTWGPRGARETGRDDGGGRVRRTSCRDFARLVRATRACITAPGRRLASSSMPEKQTERGNEVSHKISPTDSA